MRWLTQGCRAIGGAISGAMLAVVVACTTGERVPASDSLGAIAVAANAQEQDQQQQAQSPRPQAQASTGSITPATPDAFGAWVGFRSRARLVDHYEKHGAEFGDVSMAEYLRRAQALRDAPIGGDVLEIVRPDGVASRFDRASGAFLAFDRDGTIRTYFRPNDGEAYFRRQARRRPQR